jgi:hypothetical protein
MKRIILQLFVIIFCVTTLISAQSQISAGPTIGINFATFNGNDANQFGNLSSKTGLYIGGFFNIRFTELFALQPEMAFTMKGSDGTINIYGYNYNITYKTNYIEIPVLLKFYIPIQGARTIKPNLYIGPAFAFKVSSNVEVSANGNGQTADISNTTKDFDLGLAFGGGIGFLVGRGVLDFSLRYTLGLTSIDDSGANMEVTNGVIAIIANYAFSL